MRRDLLPALAALVLAAAPATARAQLWFNGDGAGNSANSSYVGLGSPGGAVIFDNFVVPVGQLWTVHTVFGDFATEDFGRVSALTWQVRTGMVPDGSVGTLVAGGTDAFSAVGERHTLSVTPFDLAPGEYWLGVWADFGTLPPGAGTPYFGPRKGDGVNGSNALLDATHIYLSTADGNVETGSPNDSFAADFALGVDGRVAAVPEPGTWALLGTGLLALGGVARRRRVRR